MSHCARAFSNPKAQWMAGLPLPVSMEVSQTPEEGKSDIDCSLGSWGESTLASPQPSHTYHPVQLSVY